MSAPLSASPADTRLPVLDAGIFANLRELDADEAGFLADVVTLFRAETPPRIAEIRRCTAANAARDLAGVAHALKGSARALGLLRFAEAGQQIESIGMAGRLPCATMLQRLESEFDSATRALAELCGTGG
jgi:HPt (histidine-containing phosphotransfer) domain-containing protein